MQDFNELVSNLCQLLQIASVKGKPESGAPLGINIKKALDYSLLLAQKFGFEVKNYDGYVGEILFGEGEDFAILCHIDVVPSGDENKWKYPPFSATIENETIYARGAIDDKGPFIATLYAMKALKDGGFVPNKRIHLIIGGDEESGWSCIEHYKKYAQLPKTGFSPDASFPVIYAEKGIYQAEFCFDFDKERLLDINGGIAANVVCDFAQAKCPYNEDIATECGLRLSGDKIQSFGKSAHASTPENGKNAIEPLLAYLTRLNLVDNRIYDYFVKDSKNLKQISDETGNLTFSADMIYIKGGKLCVVVDIRYPSTKNIDEILSRLDKVEIVELHHQKPIYNNPESQLISVLNEVYGKHKGVKSKPVAIGGGTYARAIELGAGFGPEDIGEEMLCHQPNERITFDKLKFLFEVYKDAIFKLCK